MSVRYSVACREDPRHHWIADEPGNEYEGRCPQCGSLGLTNYGRLIVEAADVTDAIIEQAIDTADGFFGSGPVDWENLIDRMESVGVDGLCFGDDWDSPAIRKIKREVRAARRES